ncbi:hypothetical protein DL768_002895 [Monosporascus sp. mg162]|nr:hypothetical protein DL768_002895 [Monosporascus sp. mg162]
MRLTAECAPADAAAVASAAAANTAVAAAAVAAEPDRKGTPSSAPPMGMLEPPLLVGLRFPRGFRANVPRKARAVPNLTSVTYVPRSPGAPTAYISTLP